MADVACAGILVADTFCGPIPALPRPGELLAVDQMPVRVGGCAANVAIDIAKQRISVDVLGCVGKDASAQVVLGSLRGAGVGCDRVFHDPHRPTSSTVILLISGEDRRYIHTFGANAGFSIAQIPDAALDGLKVFYLGGLFVLPGVEIRALAHLLERCRKRGIVTVVDVVVPLTFSGAGTLGLLLPHVDYFLPNDDEAQRLTGMNVLDRQVRTLLGFGAGTVIVTRGGAGAVAARKDQAWRIGTYPMAAVDPSGSGDAFAAGIVTGIVRGWDLPRMLTYASALGASATRAIGTTDGVFTGAEAEEFMGNHQLAVDPAEFRIPGGAL